MGWFNRKKEGARLCPNCGKPAGRDIVFCESCGLRLLPPPSCSKCKLPLAPETNFCEACGTPVGTAPVPQAESRAPEESPGEPEKNRKGKKGRASRGQKAKKRDRGQAPGPAAGENKPPGSGLPEPPVAAPLPDKPDTVNIPARPVPARVPGPGKRRILMGAMAAGLLCLLVILAGQSTLQPLKKPGMAGAAGIPEGPAPETTSSLPANANAAAGTTGMVQEIVPGPTEVPPERLRIWLQAEREPITHKVTVLYDGGMGQYAVRDILVRLTRSDGQVLSAIFRPLVTGEGVTLQGTEYSDRLEVIVTYATGEQYTVIDKIFEYKKRS